MKLVVGLGNPGPRYADTRHNIGFLVIDEIARQFPVQRLVSDSVMMLYQAIIDHCHVLLLQPQTYMNLSGIAVRQAIQDYDIVPHDIAVIYDDLDLDVGRLRIRKKGGHGGHKGVRSILEHVEAPNFVRLRMGIGRPDSAGAERELLSCESNCEARESIVEYVLHPFTHEELPVIREAVVRAADALRLIMAGQVDAAMNAFNRS